MILCCVEAQTVSNTVWRTQPSLSPATNRGYPRFGPLITSKKKKLHPFLHSCHSYTSSSWFHLSFPYLSLHCPFPLSFIPLFVLTSPPCIPSSPSERLLPLHLATMLSQASAIVFCMKACWYCLKWSSLILCRLVGPGWTLELPGKTKSLWSPKGASRRASLHTESSLLIFSQQMINQKAKKYEVTSAGEKVYLNTLIY